MKYQKLCISMCLLLFSICILINVIKICNKSHEHFDTQSEIKNLNARLNTLSRPQQLVTKKVVYVTPPNVSSTGLHAVVGPLMNGNNMVLTRSAGKKTPPNMINKPGFILPQMIWYLDMNGNIRNKWDSIHNQMGSCLFKNGESVKCSDPKYTTKKDCIKNKKIWYESVGLTKNKTKCDKWTWDAHGRITHNPKGVGGGTKECLIPINTEKNGIITGTERCTDNNVTTKQLWSFF